MLIFPVHNQGTSFHSFVPSAVFSYRPFNSFVTLIPRHFILTGLSWRKNKIIRGRNWEKYLALSSLLTPNFISHEHQLVLGLYFYGMYLSLNYIYLLFKLDWFFSLPCHSERYKKTGFLLTTDSALSWKCQNLSHAWPLRGPLTVQSKRLMSLFTWRRLVFSSTSSTPVPNDPPEGAPLTTAWLRCSPLPAFLSTIRMAGSHAHSLVHCLWLLLLYKGRVKGCHRDHLAGKVQHIYHQTLYKKVY